VRSIAKAIAASLVIAALWSVPAGAKDFCISSGGGLIVFKDFLVPPRGKCKPISGWSPTADNKDLIMGTACTFANGSEVRLGFHSVPLAVSSTPFHYMDDTAVAFNPGSTTASLVDRLLFFQGDTVEPLVHEATVTVGPCNVPFP
jgi:hypothetical protein